MSYNDISGMKPSKLGALFALLTILCSFALGATLGLFENEARDYLKVEAEGVKDTVYKGDEAKINEIINESLSYCRKAHTHSAGLGAIALAVIVYMGVIGTAGFIKFIGSLCIGLGALGYTAFWVVAAWMAPTLGSAVEAKNELYWLSQGSGGLCILGMLFALLAFLGSLFSRREEDY